MIITRGGEVYTIEDDKTINEYFTEHSTRALWQISVRSASGMFIHIAKGKDRANCFAGLLQHGFTIEREPGDLEKL